MTENAPGEAVSYKTVLSVELEALLRLPERSSTAPVAKLNTSSKPVAGGNELTLISYCVWLRAHVSVSVNEQLEQFDVMSVPVNVAPLIGSEKLTVYKIGEFAVGSACPVA